MRYEADRDMVYLRMRWFLRQELSLEIPELEEDLVLDVRTSSVCDFVVKASVINPDDRILRVMVQTVGQEGQGDWFRGYKRF